MRVFISLIISICILSYGCISTPNLEKDCEISKDEAITLETRASIVDSVYFRLLPDPYSLQNMQSVYDKYSLDNPVILQPTDFYVRFLPQTKEDLDLLESIEDLDLSPIPLDAEIEDENAYLDSLGGEDKFHWLYTTVPVDFIFPTGVQYEVIRECYIPLDGETIVNTRAGEIDVEAMAYTKLGYELEIGVNSSGNKYPTGFVRVKTSFEENPIGVEGVKVVCHTFTKRASAYTDPQGYYTINTKFNINPRYKVVFKNSIYDFVIWGNCLCIAPAQQCLGKHSKHGYDITFVEDDKGWCWSVINNAACDCYSYCSENGFYLPPEDLKIWALPLLARSAAPMCTQVSTFIKPSWDIDRAEKLINAICGGGITAAEFFLYHVLPDIFIGTKKNDDIQDENMYKKISRSVFHELSHASHYVQAGEDFWARYIGYIITHLGYGDNVKLTDAELCAIGEMWGYTMGELYYYRKFKGDEIVNDNYPYEAINGWIYPHIFWDLINHHNIGPQNIYNCLTSSVDTYEELVQALVLQNPDKANEIIEVFNNYDVIVDLSNKQICNQIYDEPSIESGYIVEISNIHVEPGSSLTILFKDRVTLSDSFYVDRDAKLELCQVE